MVLAFLILLILESMAYLFFMTMANGFTTMLTVDLENMFDELYRYPFGPVGYYALGILLAIFYFEYHQAVSNRELKQRKAYKLITHIGRNKKRQMRYQCFGVLLQLLLIFSRWLSFGGLDIDYSP